MTTIQTIIVFLWFVPVLGFIVLPLLWSVFGLLFRFAERISWSNVRGFVALNNRDAAGIGEVEHRNRARIHLEGGHACIGEETGCCRATVSDISGYGICLRNIPKKMYQEGCPFRVVFRTRQKDYSVTARPVWKKLAGNEYVVGAQIERVTTGWKELVSGVNRLFGAMPA